MDSQATTELAQPRSGKTAFWCATLAVSMLALAFASVPLYDLFCRMTGYGGTTMVSTTGAARTGERDFAIRFDSNVAPGLPWRFTPEASVLNVRSGETQTVSYTVTNTSGRETVGIATYNVQPEQAGQYFNKLQCFCFNEMTLKPGESVEVPVVFFVDPAIEKDADLRSSKAITLSYTFFPSKNGSPVAPSKSAAVLNR